MWWPTFLNDSRRFFKFGLVKSMNEMEKFATSLIAASPKTEIVFSKILDKLFYRKRRNAKSVSLWWSEQCVFAASNRKSSPVGGFFENIYCILKKGISFLAFWLVAFDVTWNFVWSHFRLESNGWLLSATKATLQFSVVMEQQCWS